MQFNYFKYVVRHRWLVLLACIELGIFWRGVFHDMSKFSPYEWKAYVDKFWGPFGIKWQEEGLDSAASRSIHRRVNEAFKRAWSHHFHTNAHHWEHWIIPGTEECLEIPEVYCREMVADWNAMSKARGINGCYKWYQSQKDIIKLHPTSRNRIEELILATSREI